MGLVFVDGFDDGLALRGKWDQAAGDLTTVNGRHYSGPAEERLDDNDARIVYVGAWSTTLTNAGYYGGTAQFTTAAGRTSSLTFTGTGIRWISAKSSTQGIAEVFLDDVLVATVDNYAATTEFQSLGYENLNLAPGEHTIRIRVTGTKNASSTDTGVHVDAFDVFNRSTNAMSAAMRLGPDAPDTRVQNDNTRIAYVGTWSSWSDVKASGGSYHSSTAADTTASLTFTGTGIRWIAIKGTSGAIAEVFLDGVLVATFDAYAAAAEYQVVGYENLNLAYGEHTIRIRNTGTKNASSGGTYTYVDAFDIINDVKLSKDLGPDAHPTVMTGFSLMSSDGAAAPAIVPAANLLRFTGGGVDRLRIALNADGTLTAFNGATALGTSTRALTPGQHHYLEARRVIGASGQALVRLDGYEVINAAIADPAPTEERVENPDARITYVGAWTSGTATGYSSDNYTRSSEVDATASLTFTGTGIQWVTVTGLGQGIAEVFLDDALVATVDLYSDPQVLQVVGYENLNLAYGEHTIRIRVTGTKNASATNTLVTIDAFDVINSPQVESVTLNGHDAASGELVVDDLWVLNGAGNPAPELLGDVVVETHYPDAAGFYTQMIPSVSGEPNFSMVNDPGDPDTTTYVSSANRGDRDSYSFSDLIQGEQVKGVMLSALAKQSAAGDLKVALTSRGVRPKATPTEERVENSNTRTAYAGTWTLETHASSSGGDHRYSITSGATASLTFVGSGVRWISRRGGNLGIAEVFVDDLLVATVDLYGASEFQYVAYENLNLVPGEHTIRVRVTATKNASSSDLYIIHDAFDVLDSKESFDVVDAPEALTLNDKPYVWVMERNPGTGELWTPAEVTGTEFGIQNYRLRAFDGFGRTGDLLGSTTEAGNFTWERLQTDTTGNIATNGTVAHIPQPASGTIHDTQVVNVGAADGEVIVEIVSLGYLAGAVFRQASAGNFFRTFILDTGELRLDRVSAGTATTLASVASMGATKRLRATFAGSAIEVFADGVSKIAVTDTAHETATRHGLQIMSKSTSEAQIDSFEYLEA